MWTCSEARGVKDEFTKMEVERETVKFMSKLSASLC